MQREFWMILALLAGFLVADSMPEPPSQMTGKIASTSPEAAGKRSLAALSAPLLAQLSDEMAGRWREASR